MAHFQSFIYFFFASLLFAYYAYRYNIAVKQIGDGDDRPDISMIATHQYFSRSSGFFNHATPHDYCKCTLSNGRNIIGVRLCTLLNHTLHEDNQPIVPPLGQTGCESEANDPSKNACEGQFQLTTITAVCVAAGLFAVPMIVIVAWTLARWIQAVRPGKEKLMTEKKDVGPTRRGWLGKVRGFIQKLFMCTKAQADEEYEVELGIKRGKKALEEKEVWFEGVNISIPWWRGRSESQVVSWQSTVESLMEETNK